VSYSKAIAVVSGGMDSITNALMLTQTGYQVTMLHFNYGQRCETAESDACRRIAHLLKVEPLALQEVKLDFYKRLPSGALVNEDEHIPDGLADLYTDTLKQLFVPARNVVFLSIAAAFAEAMGASIITLGGNQSELAYSDNSHEFFYRFSNMLQYGCYRSIPKVVSPIYDLDKVELVKWGYDHGFGQVYDHTYSCDAGTIPPCGVCGCCRNRRVTFLVLDRLHGIKDGQSYQDERWFHEKFLPHYTNQRGKAIWFDKYLDVIRRPR